METTEQKINLQLNIDGYKFFETTQSFDDDQTYSNLIQGFMDDLDYKLENMKNPEDEPVDEELYGKVIPHKKPKLQISILIDIPEKEANSIISYIRLPRTNRPNPIPRILNHLPRTRIQLQLPHKVQNPETKNTEPNRTRIPTTNQEPNPIQPNK